MNKRVSLLVGFLIGVIVVGCTQQHLPQPPVAKIVPKADTLNGDIRIDDYYWLRDVDRTNPDVLNYLKAENAYTDEIMKPTEALQETLYSEMVRRIKETDESAPYRDGDYFYYTRTEKGKQYPIYCRKHGNLDAPETIYLDQNELSKGYRFFRVWARDVNPDGSTLAYSVDTSGAENYVIYIKNLADETLYADRVEHTQDLVWAADNRTLLYTREDSAHRPYRIYRHVAGTPQSTDELVYEEDDPAYSVDVSRSRSNRYIYLVSSAANSDEWRYIPADKPMTQPTVIVPRRAGHEYSVGDWGSYFYIRTNSSAPTFRIVRAPIADPSEENWTEVLPYREEITIEGMDFFRDHSVVSEREKGLIKFFITDLRTRASHFVEFPDPVYTAGGIDNAEYRTNVFRYRYQSLTRPPSVFDYNMDTHDQTLIKQQEVLGGYDPAQYESERIFAKAPDGVEVPISLVYRRGTPKDGTAPLHLTGYGAYGISSEPTFSSGRLSYLDRGVMFAIAHVRGGGDMGREWYNDGKLLHKKNTFTDFIACAEHLIDQKYTSTEKLTISGASAGGLLMGAVTTMRPDLFKAVIANVPFVDALNTMLDPSLMYTTEEYLEWGNPNETEYYDYMKSYDPYTNTKRQGYPNILVKVGLNDPRVNYWEGTKWAAKLRAMNTSGSIILLKVNMGAGHMGASGRYERIRENAFDYAYILSQYGILH
jgi:oligopeptidase B